MVKVRTGWLLIAILAAAPLAAQAEEFNRTVPVQAGTRLDVRLYGGIVTIRAWDRDAVRVRATHFATDRVECELEDGAVRVRARTLTGAPHPIDLDIDVPVWMAIAVAGPYVDVGAEGTHGGLTVETVRGDIRVTGGAGRLDLSSIEGQVVLEGGRGSARLRAANNGARVSGFDGDLQVETVEGSVRLLRVAASKVEVSTMGGDILWDGPLARDGRYQLVTHSGDIDVTLPPTAGATVTVHALDGHVYSQFGTPARPDPDGPFTLVIGPGLPPLLVESFNGIISLRKSEPGSR